MKVEVDYQYYTNSRGWEWKPGNYAYETDLRLKVGDIVLVPTIFEEYGTLAVVRRIGTNYTGRIQRVIRPATRDEIAERPSP